MNSMTRNILQINKLVKNNNTSNLFLRGGKFKQIKFFATLNSPKLKNKSKKEINPQDYTTYSYFNKNENDILKNIVQRAKDEKEQKKSKEVDETVNTTVICAMCIPLSLYCGFALFDQIFYGKLSYYTFQLFLKHTFVINALNTGILMGYKLSDEKQQGVVTSENVEKSLKFLAGTFAGIYVVSNFPLGYILLNACYLGLAAGNVYIAQEMKVLSPVYSNYLTMVLYVAFGIMFVIINLNLKEYKQKIANQGKFEDAYKFFELSSDREFKKVMNNFEDYLYEIDVKIERAKDEEKSS